MHLTTEMTIWRVFKCIPLDLLVIQKDTLVVVVRDSKSYSWHALTCPEGHWFVSEQCILETLRSSEFLLTKLLGSYIVASESNS